MPSGSFRDVQEAASAIGLQVDIVRASTDGEIDSVFASLGQPLVVSPGAIFFSRREQIVALASRYAVPAIYPGPEFTAIGGLISYGPRITEVLRQLGVYTGRILKGAKPADLPVLQPTTFELVVNLNTAVPPSILARADEVIE